MSYDILIIKQSIPSIHSPTLRCPRGCQVSTLLDRHCLSVSVQSFHLGTVDQSGNRGFSALACLASDRPTVR